MSINSNKPVIIKRLNQSLEKIQRHFQPIQQPSRESVLQLEIEQPEQPVAVEHIESLAEPPRDESIYGSGWSVAQLMSEFGRRYGEG